MKHVLIRSMALALVAGATLGAQAQSTPQHKHYERPAEFDMQVAFGDEAMGGVGQCGNPSDRASGRCKLRLAEGGPAVVDGDLPSTAVGLRFRWRF